MFNWHRCSLGSGKIQPLTKWGRVKSAEHEERRWEKGKGDPCVPWSLPVPRGSGAICREHRARQGERAERKKGESKGFCGAPQFPAVWGSLSSHVPSDRTRRLDIWERFSTKRVAKPWRGLVVESSSLQVFKNHLNVALQQQSYPKVPTHSSDHLILWHDTYRKTNSIAKGSSSF